MRRVASRTAQSAGAALETLANLHHTRAREQGLADIRKVEPPVRRLRSLAGGQFVAVYAAKSGCDFRGTLRGGKALAIECKSGDGESLAHSEFTAAEVLDLDECAALGGLSIVLWYRRDLRSMYAIPWQSMPWKKSGRGQSVRAEDVRDWFVIEMPYLKRFVEPAR